MKPMERLKFHLQDGVLRKWSMWNEAEYPAWASEMGGGATDRYEFFQHWKNSDPRTNNAVNTFPFQESFTLWPYWLVVDLYLQVFKATPFELEHLFPEPENLLEAIVDALDGLQSQHEPR